MFTWSENVIRAIVPEPANQTENDSSDSLTLIGNLSANTHAHTCMYFKMNKATIERAHTHTRNPGG